MLQNKEARREVYLEDRIKFEYNIILIGFMGTGKSSVSRYLNENYKMQEIDVDQLIVEKEGMEIADIFQSRGEEYFRDCESAILETLLQQRKSIISCGGGIVLRKKNIELMKENGKIILLTGKPETILQRVKDNTERPILNGNMNTTFIEELMEKRRNHYEKAADLVVETDGKTIKEVAEEIISRLIQE